MSQNRNCLSQRLGLSGLKFRGKTPSDGNRLFHAVSDQLQRVGARPMYNHSELRVLAVKQLTDDPFVVQDSHGQKLNMGQFVIGGDWLKTTLEKDGAWRARPRGETTLQ